MTPFLKTNTWEHTFSTSSSRCEANNIVVPWAAICLIISLMNSWGSRPFVGSSRINISGSFSRQRQWPDVVSSLKKSAELTVFFHLNQLTPVFPEFWYNWCFLFYRLVSGFALPSCMDKSLGLSIIAPTFSKLRCRLPSNQLYSLKFCWPHSKQSPMLWTPRSVRPSHINVTLFIERNIA
jgi:hypothetical protein